MLTRLDSAIADIYRAISFDKKISPEELASERLAVGVSGGADSIFLAFLLHQIKANILAITVDHRLQPGSAETAGRVKTQLGKIGLETKILTWNHEDLKSGIETKAREARYRLMIEECKRRGVKQLFIAHHRGDQVETFLMNLARGSGLDGLSGIKPVSELDGIMIIRPMLDISKEEILDYLRSNNIDWQEDPTNHDESISHRNAIRKVLKTARDSHFLESRIWSATQRLSEAKSIVDKSVKQTMNKIVCWNNEQATIQTDDYRALLFGEKTYIISSILMTFSDNGRKGRFKDLERLIKSIDSCARGKKTLSHSIIQWNETGIVFSKEA